MKTTRNDDMISLLTKKRDESHLGKRKESEEKRERGERRRLQQYCIGIVSEPYYIC
jgi:hypothetical protein